MNIEQPPVIGAQVVDVQEQPPPVSAGVLLDPTQPAPYNATIEVEDEMAKIVWFADPSVAITEFRITRSLDKGITFPDLVTIPFNQAGGAYDRATKVWSYVDSAGAPGAIYRIVANGTNGLSQPAVAITPPAEALMCSVIGYLRDSFGNVDRQAVVQVQTYGARGEAWAKSPAGLLSVHPSALGVSRASKQVYPDENGIWGVDFLRGTLARVWIPSLEWGACFYVPDAAGPVNVRDIPQLKSAGLELYADENGERLHLPLS